MSAPAWAAVVAVLCVATCDDAAASPPAQRPRPDCHPAAGVCCMLLAMAISDPFVLSAVFASWSIEEDLPNKLLATVFRHDLHSVPTVGLQRGYSVWAAAILGFVKDWKDDNSDNSLSKVAMQLGTPVLRTLFSLVGQVTVLPVVARGPGV